MFKEMGVIDCDGHVAEPFELYTEYSEAEFKQRMPQRIDRDGECIDITMSFDDAS